MSAGFRLGVLGAGSFGQFAVENFLKVEGVRVVAIAGTSVEDSRQLQQRFGIPDLGEPEHLINHPEVDLIYIAAPPFLHHPWALLALHAGKHVICEKPLALSLDEADEMIQLAGSRGLLLVANLLQRYNPLYDIVKSLIDSRLVGSVIHGYFENYATDETLDEAHWFWDQAKSGGIFVEHGVHFFDLFDGWLGAGDLVAAQRVLRPPRGVEEQASCTVRHGGVLVNHYHGFTQPKRMDRQELRLLFELGQVTLTGWIPTELELETLVNEDGIEAISALMGDGKLKVLAQYASADRVVVARHRQWTVSTKLRFTSQPVEKYHRYGQMVRAMLVDQLRWLQDRSHRRKVDENNGRASLASALDATSLAVSINYPPRGHDVSSFMRPINGDGCPEGRCGR